MFEKWLKKLRTIVKYNQTVQSINMDDMRRSINSQLSTISTNLNTHKFDTKQIKDSITGKHLEILQILEDIDLDLNTFKEALKTEVKDMEIPYYLKSEKIYKRHGKMSGQDKRTRLRESSLIGNKEAKELLISTIKGYVSSQYACCQLQPGYGDITDHILHGSPLYIVDEDNTILQEFRASYFNPIMQHRTNFYTMKDQHDDPLYKLPQGQIGAVVAIDVFNFKTVAVITKYLKSIYKVLRPGGTTIFTFNNCDYPKGIDKVDDMYYCYTTETEMKSICIDIGFEVYKLVAHGYDELENGISWLEIKKPGELSTIRQAQGLGQIKQL